MTGMLPLNLMIALVWAAAAGDFTFANLALGFAGGFVALWAFNGVFGPGYHRRFFSSVALILYFFYDLTMSSLQVAGAVLRPSRAAHPRFVRMPLDVESDLGVMLTANLITLTPGTLSVDVSEDRRELLIHAMFGEDPEEVVASCKHGIERRVRRVAP